ncbi:asparaginase domain-containing protein [Guyparkeria hydrothermalis]|uniref:asparaginase domain-containing protein n=1 Tax=Guyparkeria hydrothermalis TaxID=923 RepID=UPI00201FDBC6|nr:asparaginase domain-containing protein [Guyparkeria hydrothermalis]MCL7745354.1 asparaginase domain-containing protein [Guyparkeria hydrothermalis]
MAVRNVTGSGFRLIVVDTGGTFNKRYRPTDGKLVVESGSPAARAILESAQENLDVEWLQPVCKDSLEMTESDREEIVAAVSAALGRAPHAPVVIIHGTDTMHLTGEALCAACPDERIVITGAMRPHEIDPVEPAFNLGLAFGFVQAEPSPGVYLAMSGLVRPLGQLVKDRAAGVFRGC